MDPVTAVALAIKAVSEMVTEISKGQTVEQKQQLWAWYIEDVKWWRDLLHPRA
jgi:hypothetical protein